MITKHDFILHGTHMQYTLYTVHLYCIMYTQGCKSVSSIGGDDQHILVTFLILGDDFKTSFFDDLFFARQAFFHHFLLKFNYWGDVYPHPPNNWLLTKNGEKKPGEQKKRKVIKKRNLKIIPPNIKKSPKYGDHPPNAGHGFAALILCPINYR